jgi:hypothetical protein
MESFGAFAAGCDLSAKSVVPEFILFGRRVTVMVMGLAVVGIVLTLLHGTGIPDVVVNA